MGSPTLDALAAQFGGKPTHQQTDPNAALDAIATKFGGKPVTAVANPDPLQRPIMRAEDLPSEQEFNDSHQAAVTAMDQALTPPAPGLHRDATQMGRPRMPQNAQPNVNPLTSFPPILQEGAQFYADLPAVKAATNVIPETPRRVARGAVKGGLQLAEGLMAPSNIALMMGAGPLGKYAPKLARWASKGFTVQMLADLSRQVPEVADAIKSGDPEEIARAVTTATGTAIFAGLAGKHGFGKAPEAAPTKAAPEPAKPLQEIDAEQYLKDLAEKSPGTPPSSAKESAAAFAKGKTYTELFDEAQAAFDENQRQAQAALDEKKRSAEGRSKRPPKATVPSEGIPDQISRVVEARDRLARQLAGKPFRDLTNPDRLAIDDLIQQGHGFGVTLEELASKHGGVKATESTDRAGEVSTQGAEATGANRPTPISEPIPAAQAKPTEPTAAAQGEGEGAPAKPVERVRGPAVVGNETEIPVEGRKQPYKGRYVVRELSDIQASHHGQSFEPNADYPLTNDRDYKNNAEIAGLVSQRSTAEGFTPERILSDSPVAEEGPSIIDEKGNVLGGNSRKMILDRVYGRGGEEAYTNRLHEKAATFGLDPNEIAKLKQPVLTRELTGPVNGQEAITDFNKPSTATLKPEERAVTDGRRMSPKTVGELSARLGELGENGTMAEALRGDNGVDVANMLEADGVITAPEKTGMLQGEQLTPEAKARIGKALVGRLFNTPREYATTQPEMLAKLERIAPQALRVEGRAKWDLTPTIREALTYLDEQRARGVKKVTIPLDAGRSALDQLVKAGLLEPSRVDLLLDKTGKKLTAEGKAVAEKLWRRRATDELVNKQTTLGERRTYSPEAMRLADVLLESPRNAEYAFRRYAADAELSKPGSQTSMFDPPTQQEAWNDAFGELPPAEAAHADEAPMQRLEGKTKPPIAERLRALAGEETGSVKLPTRADVDRTIEELRNSHAGIVVNAGLKVGRSLGARVKAEGGGAGRVLMNLIEKADDYGNVAAGRLLARIADIQPSKLSRESRFKVMDAMEGRVKPADLTAQERRAYEVYKDADTELGLHATGLGVEVMTKNGRRPFSMMQDHYPHVLKSAAELKRGAVRADVIDNIVRQGIQPNKAEATKFVDDWVSYLESGKRKQSLLEHLVDTGQAANEAEALAKLERYRSNIQRHGSLEYSRELNLPFYDPDPVRVMPFTLAAGAKRLGQIAVFGQDHRVINQEILNISRAGGDSKFVRDAVDRMIGKDLAHNDDAVFSRFVRSLSTLKMSLAAIPNATQVLNNVVAGDLPSFAAGLKDAFTPGGRRLAIESGASIDPVLSEAMRQAGGSPVMDHYLRATGFNAVERFNRVVSANAGLTWANRNLKWASGTGKQAAAARARLQQLGVEDVDAAVKRGKLSDYEKLLAAKKFSDLTQFRTRAQDLPGFATESPWGKAWFQFKGFAYQQARFAAAQTYGEFASGNPGRGMRSLLLMAVVFPWTAGEAVRLIRNGITGRDDKFKTAVERYYSDLAQASSAGIMLDTVNAIETDRVEEFVGGPAVGQAKDLGTMLRAVADDNKTKEQKFRAVEKYALGRFGSAGRRLLPK